MTARAKRLAPAVMLLLCSCNRWQSALDAHGSSALSLKQLVLLIVTACSVVWMLVMIALIFALRRRHPGRAQPVAVDPATARRMAGVVIAAVAATVIVISGFTVMSFYTTRALVVAGPDDLTIKIGGLQWWWNVQYLGPSADQTFTTANEIHIPIGRKVRFQLEGDDVIHSFWVPSLAGKQDLIPGRPNELSLRAERPGVYRGQCAEFCGMQHAHMAFFVVAEDAADYEKWANAQRQSAVEPTGEEAAAGRQAFLSKPCASCHTIRGTTATGTSGPDLTHVGSRKYIGAGLFETTRGSLAAWIADPQTLKPGNNMPMVPLSRDELLSISAYLASLK